MISNTSLFSSHTRNPLSLVLFQPLSLAIFQPLSLVISLARARSSVTLSLPLVVSFSLCVSSVCTRSFSLSLYTKVCECVFYTKVCVCVCVCICACV